MGLDLFNKQVLDTYDAIIKVGDNNTLTGTPKRLSDGRGNDAPIYLGTSTMGIGITPSSGVTFEVNGLTKLTSVNITGSITNGVTIVGQTVTDSLKFTGGAGTQGTVSWNADEETLDLVNNGAVLQLGQEIHIHVRNNSVTTAIPNGTPVYVAGTLGASGRLKVAPMIADGSVSPEYFIGVTTEEIEADGDGKVTFLGKVRGFNTLAYAEGAKLYVSETVAGGWQTTHPTAPNPILEVAFVVNSNNNGTLFVRSQNGHYLDDTHDIEITSVADKDLLVYDSTNGIWKNSKTLGNVTTDYVTAKGISLGGVDTPEITFNGTSDPTIDMAIKATPEGLDFYEPEQVNKIHFQILDDLGVNSLYGYKVAGSDFVDASRNITSGTISSGNITTSGKLFGPNTFYIDPSPIDVYGDGTYGEGKVVIQGDLEVTGQTTTVNSTEVTINDKNLLLGYIDVVKLFDTVSTSTTLTLNTGDLSGVVAGMGITGSGIPADTTVVSITDATHIEISNAATATATGVSMTFAMTSSMADGAGITIGGASATLTYASATNDFTFNKNVNIVKNSSGIKTVYGNVSIEDTDAQLDLISSSAGTWGSAINFVEGAGTTNTNVWSIARKTSAGGSTLNFNFGTANQHDNTNQVSFNTTGGVTATSFIGALTGNVTGNADTASKWATARTITIGDTGKSVDGSANVSWTKAEIGITKANIDALNVNADTLDTKHAEDFTLQYVTDNGASTTNALSINSDTFTEFRSATDNADVGLRFSSMTAGTQYGDFKFNHVNTQSYGALASFVLSSSESDLAILADGKLLYKTGIYVKPATGTGAGTLFVDANRNITAGTISSGNITSTGYVHAAGTTATAPAFRVGDNDSGFFDSGSDEIGVALGGTLEYEFLPTALDLKTNALQIGGVDVITTSKDFVGRNGTFSGNVQVSGSSGTPVYFKHGYANTYGLRVYGIESAIDIIGEDDGNHSASLMLRGQNAGFGFINNAADDVLELKYFEASANDFTIHSTGTGVSTLTTVMTADTAGDVVFKGDVTVDGTFTMQGASLVYNDMTFNDSGIILATSTTATRGIIWDVGTSGFLSKIDGGGANGGMLEIYTNLDDAITTGDVFRVKEGSTAATLFSVTGNGDATISGGLNLGGNLLMDFSGTTYSDAIIFRGAASSAGEIGIRANGEAFELYEPEDGNKVWLTIADDPSNNNTAFQVNSTSGMVPVLHSINMSSYVTTAYIQSQGFLRDTTDTFTGTLTLNGSQTINGSGNGLTFSGGNNRIYFGAYRALEATTTSSATLQLGESYATTRLYGNVGIDKAVPDSRLHIYKAEDSPVLLTLENYVAEIDGDGGVHGNFIDFKTSDANATSQPQARIGMLVKDYTGENGISSEGDGNLVFYTNDGTDDLGNGTLSEVMRLTHQKNVGIGTNSPFTTFHVDRNAGGYVARFQGDTNHISIYDGELGGIGLGSNGDLKLYANDALANGITIKTNGNVNIGTSSGTAKLNFPNIVDTNGYDVSYIQFYTSSDGTLKYGLGVSSGQFNLRAGIPSDGFAFWAGTSHRMQIQGTTGNVGIGITSPSYKLDVDGSLRASSSVRLATSTDASTTIGDTHHSSASSSDTKLILGGKNLQSGASYYGNYGQLLFTASSNYTGSARKWLITNAVDANKFSIIMGDSNQITPTIGAAGGISGGSPVITINDSALVGIGTTSPSKKLTIRHGATDGLRIEYSGNTDNMLIDASTISAFSGTTPSTLKLNPNGGNVGIGTTSPSAKLHLSSIESVDLRIDADTDNAGSEDHNPRLVLTQDGGGIESLFGINGNTNAQFTGAIANGAYWKTNASIQFATSNTTALTIDTSQRLGLGLVSPAYLFHMYGSSPEICIENTAETQGGLLFRDAQAVSTQWSRIAYDCADNHIKFRYGNGVTGEGFRFTNTGTFYAAADIVAYYSFSDARLKTNVKPLENSLEKVKQLQGVSYEWIDGERKGKTEVGLIAQEVEKIVPEVVREQKRLGDDTEYKTVDYEKIVGVLIEAIKEQQEQIDELKRRLDGSTN